jgi:Integrase core domain
VPASVVRRDGRWIKRVVSASFRQNATPATSEPLEGWMEFDHAVRPRACPETATAQLSSAVWMVDHDAPAACAGWMISSLISSSILLRRASAAAARPRPGRAELSLTPLCRQATVRRDVFDYIEVFFNRRRLHSSLNYMTPVEYETIMIHRQTAAHGHSHDVRRTGPTPCEHVLDGSPASLPSSASRGQRLALGSTPPVRFITEASEPGK